MDKAIMPKKSGKKKTEIENHVGLLEKAIENSRGNISVIAQRLGWSRSTVHKYISQSEELTELIRQERETTLDFAENLLTTQIKENPTLLMFFLKTQGKKRGYVEKQEIENSGEVNSIVRVSKDDIKAIVEALKDEC